MIHRAILAFLTCVLAGNSSALAANATYQRSQNFAEPPRNWRHFAPPHFAPNLFFGYEPTSNTGGPGEAGGLFIPQTFFNGYADAFLNGALSRAFPISAQGRLFLQRVSLQPPFVTSAYIGHFAQGANGFINTLGIALTGVDGGRVAAQAVLEFGDSTAFIGNPVILPVGADVPVVAWSYQWDPSGGTQGFGKLTLQIGPDDETSVISVPKSTAGLDFTLTRFGLFQPPLPPMESPSFIQLDVGRLAYTALVGRAPRLRIRGRRQVITAVSPLTITGSARAAVGNRVRAVRYRIERGGRTTRYRTATGTTNWTAEVRVPPGNSRVEVIAIGDNGLRRFASIRVQRLP